MIPLWSLFTSLHGPTSVNQDGHFLGGDPLFWGSMTSVPNLLIAAGLWGTRLLLYTPAGRTARIGYVLLLIGLTVPAVVDLATLTLGPPLLLPAVAVGLILLAVGHRSSQSLPGASRRALFSLGAVLLLGFMWALVSNEITDPMQGYRIFGIITSVLGGAGWMAVGVSLPRHVTRRG
ncbi:hypothetical protein [Deinococcus sp.]|uniref:hypothetical protein n=1 Tax=Deinococcus sp. TaxID=47478 RepID=UPI002869A57F|nr:hypothetical protein [Deinococcus sp.]